MDIGSRAFCIPDQRACKALEFDIMLGWPIQRNDSGGLEMPPSQSGRRVGIVSSMGRMSNPPHPVETLKEDVLPALGLTVAEAAHQLGVTRTPRSRVLNGRAGVSPDMARRIEAWLGQDRGGRADLWLGLQLDYDLWQAQQ